MQGRDEQRAYRATQFVCERPVHHRAVGRGRPCHPTGGARRAHNGGYAGPIEHITQNAWAGAARWFPGLLLEGVAEGGNAQASVDRALVLTAMFAVALAVTAFAAFRRSDVTA
jgi:hypothetical protein